MTERSVKYRKAELLATLQQYAPLLDWELDTTDGIGPSFEETFLIRYSVRINGHRANGIFPISTLRLDGIPFEEAVRFIVYQVEGRLVHFIMEWKP